MSHSTELKGNVTLSSDIGATNIGGWIDSGYSLAKLKETAAIAANSSNMMFWDNTETLQYALIISNSTGAYDYALLDLKNFTVIPNTNYRITIRCWANVTDMSFSFDYPQNSSLYKTLASTTLTTYTFTITPGSNTTGFFSLVLRTASNTAVASGSKYLYVASIKIEKPTASITTGSVYLNNTLGTSSGLYTTGRSYIGGTNAWPYAAHNISGIDATYRDCLALYAVGTNGMAFIVFKGVGGTEAGSIGNSSGAGALYNTSSDRRLKTNIQPMDSMLDNIMKMKPSKYNWVSDTDIEDYGFIAQEVFELFPNMRTKRFNADDNLDEPCDENGNPIYYGLDYGKFTPYIVKALQEMKLDYETKFQEYETKFQEYETKFQEYETKFLEQEAKYETKFQDYETKFLEQEARFELLNQRFELLNQRLEA